MGIIEVMSAIERPPGEVPRVAQPAAALAGVDLNLLVVLAVLLDEASVTRAAARLGRTQSAVSHALDRLREVFKDPLFVRSGQRMVPTPRAEALRAPVADVASRLHDLWIGAPPFDPAAARRRFVLTASDYLQIVLVPPLVQRLRRVAPGVTLEVRGPRSRLLERLSRGEYDFSLSIALDESPSLFSQRLFTDRFACLVADDHPAVRGGLDRATFVRLPHVLVAPLGSTPSGHVDRELARAGEARRVVVVLPDFMVAPRVLRGTDLVLTLPERVARLFEGRGVRLLPPPIDLPPLAAHLVWHERLSRDPASQWFRRVVDETVKSLDAAARDEPRGRLAR